MWKNHGSFKESNLHKIPAKLNQDFLKRVKIEELS